MIRTLLASSILALAACHGGGGQHDGGGNGDDAIGDDGGDDDAGPTFPDASPAPFCTPQSGTAMKLTPVASGLSDPVAVAAPPGDPRLFVVEQPGRIRVVKNGALLTTPFLTVDTNDLPLEAGLLGLAFHPQYATNHRFFILYVRPGVHTIRIAEHTATGDVASATEKVILDIPHNSDADFAGTLAFGPDGYLYASTGDDAANNFAGNGQNPDVLMGKVLRLDIDGGDPYAIPATNPWATTGGVPEMYSWGERNPWRIAIDASNGDLWIGDVGEGDFEEINVVRSGSPGKNFGWAVFEGSTCFTGDPDGNAGCSDMSPYTFPVMSYDRTGTGQCVVILGGVYRGSCMPDLVGQVFFGDWCSGEVRSFAATSSTITYAATTDRTDDVDPTNLLEGKLVAFGADGYGELYAVSRAGGAVYRLELE